MSDTVTPPTPTATSPSTRAVALTTVTSLALMTMGFTTGVISARLLGPEGRGVLAAAQTIGTLVGTYSMLSLGESLIYFVRTRARPAPVVLKSATALALIPVGVAAVAAIAVMPLVLGADDAALSATRWYCLVGLPFVLLGFPIAYRLATGDATGWNVLRWIAPTAWLLTLLGFAVAGSTTVPAIVATFIVVQLAVAPLLWRRSFRRRGSWRAAPVDRSTFRPMVRYGAPLILATVPTTLSARVDQLVVAQLVVATTEPAAELGRYTVSVSLAAVGVVVLASVGTILFPHLAALPPSEQIDALARAVRATVIVAFGVLVASAAAAPVVIPVVFGDEYAVPVVVPTALAVVTALLGLNLVLEAGLRGLNAPVQILLAELAGIIATVALVVALLPPLGISGAALGTIGGALVVTASLVGSLRHRFGVRPTDLLVPRRADLRALLARVPRRPRS